MVSRIGSSITRRAVETQCQDSLCHSSFLLERFIHSHFISPPVQTHYAFLIQMKSISEPTRGINLLHKFSKGTFLRIKKQFNKKCSLEVTFDFPFVYSRLNWIVGLDTSLNRGAKYDGDGNCTRQCRFIQREKKTIGMVISGFEHEIEGWIKVN